MASSPVRTTIPTSCRSRRRPTTTSRGPIPTTNRSPARAESRDGEFLHRQPFPGSVSYHYDRNSTGTFGLTGQPNFTTIGKGQGFGINWSALLPGLPTLSVGYSQGSGTARSTEPTQKPIPDTQLFNLHSNYAIAGFRLNGFFDRNSFELQISRQFLTGRANRCRIPLGTISDSGRTQLCRCTDRSTPPTTGHPPTATTSRAAEGAATSNISSYTDDTETANASFHPTQKFGFNVTKTTPTI